MATIPISDGTPKNSYIAAAGQTIFPYTFWVKDAGHIAVYVNNVLKVITVDYTVSSVQSPTGDNVVFNSGLTEDDTVVIVYDPKYERTSEYTGTIRLNALNTELTYVLTLLQNNKRVSENAIRISDEETVGLDAKLPSLTGNGGRVFALKSDLSGVEFVTISSDSIITSNYEDESFNGDTVETDFTLSFSPSSQNAVLVYVDDVRQRPAVDYTIVGTTLSFTSAPGSGTDNIVVLNTAASTSVNIPADGSVEEAKLGSLAVTSGKIASSAVSTAKIADDAVTLGKLEHGTQGDILYYGTSGQPLRLAAGTVGQVLQTNGSGANPSWTSVTEFTASDITGQTNATIAAADQIVFADADDSGNLKEDTVQGIVNLAGWQYDTAVVTTSGTQVTASSSIPSTAQEIVVFLNDVSGDSTNSKINLTIGDAGGEETSGYLAGLMYSTSSYFLAGTANLPLTEDGLDAGNVVTGMVRLSLADASTNTWKFGGDAIRTIASAPALVYSYAGSKSLSGTLTTIYINYEGTAFNAGSVRVAWR
jgi:hypothetical protein